MNTTRKGDDFEQKCYELIQIGIVAGQLGIEAKSAKIFQKKGYPSKKRNKEIIIDISIETWPPDATRPFMIYLIECKNYSSKVPVSDVEEFYSKVAQIADQNFNVKGIFITNSSFQSGALEVGKNYNFMMIEAGSQSLNIKYHKAERRSNKQHQLIFDDKKIETFFRKIFDANQSKNLATLSKRNIEIKANEILNEINTNILKRGFKYSLDDLIKYFEQTHNVKFNLQANFDEEEKEILGYYSVRDNEIQINQTLNQSNRQAFIVAHEMGHYILHKNIIVSQEYYDSFQDSQYDIKADRYVLENFRHWIEWQANYFATCLLMPRKNFFAHLLLFQRKEGIREEGRIYLDNQRVNRKDFQNIVSYLSSIFNTAKTSVIYRLNELNVIVYANGKNSYHDEIERLTLQLEEDYLDQTESDSIFETSKEE